MARKNLMERFIKKTKFNRNFKDENKRSICLQDVLQPINNLCVIFGLRVYEISRNYPKSIFTWLYSILLFCLNCIIWRFREKYINQSRVFNFDKTVGDMIYFLNHIVLLVIIGMGLYQSKLLKLSVKKIHEIDKTLEELGSSSLFDKIYKKTIMEIVFFTLFVLSILSIVTSEMSSHSSMIFLNFIFYASILQYVYVFMIEFLLVIEFCTIVRCIESEFQRANNLLSDFNILPISSIASKLILRSFSDDSKKLFNNSSLLNGTHSRLQIANHKLNRSRKLLRTIRQVHLELYRLSKSFSKMYGIQMSLEMAICILCNTYLLFSLYVQYMSKTSNNYNMIFRSLYTITVCSQYTIRIFAVNYICERTKKEAERTNEIIHTFYGKNTDFVIQKEVEVFSMQMMQCRTTYSAFGLYNFGCKQICSCIGIITAYVVIMIQVADSLEKES